MDHTFTINLLIADKYYPLKIKRSEEELVRKAARLINDRIAQYRNRFNMETSGLETKDLLAMAACQIALMALKAEDVSDSSPYQECVERLDEELEAFLRR
ncbi:MAG: cell division protein ZapA [Bacteroidales bacterium]|jgi:cell division protein ZapA|nr:cell division protein ZapA [Bacteroidales bacterium]MDD3166007.1 cell division protein ZapA [Bacteroidales bacterium]MDD4769950.1 cell division protein ZapA [Bacteroidales bacterium]HKL91892.1 cell division protein ZapA [Bacteroidales bacterium]